MTKKLPFMPFFGVDFYESERVRLMTYAEHGIYLSLLWHQWREGSLPQFQGDLERLLRREDEPIPEAVLECFPVGEDGRRRNAKLEEIRKGQLDKIEALSQKRSEAGKRGAEARWQKDGNPDGNPMANASDSHWQTDGKANGKKWEESESESESEPDNNNDDDSAGALVVRWEALAAPMDDLGRSALEGYRRAARDPHRLLGELESLVSGVHGPGGKPVDPPTLGRALHDMALAGAAAGGKTLQAYVRRAMEPERPTNGGPPQDDTKARMDRWAARKEAERGRR